MSKQHSDEMIEVIGPAGERKMLPRAAAYAPEIRVLGFTPVESVMPPVRVNVAKPTEEAIDPIDQAQDEPKRGPGRPRKNETA